MSLYLSPHHRCCNHYQGESGSKILEHIMFNTMIYDYGGVMLFVQIYFSIKVLKYSSFLVGWWDWDCSLKMVYYSYVPGYSYLYPPWQYTQHDILPPRWKVLLMTWMTAAPMLWRSLEFFSVHYVIPRSRT